LTCKRGLARGHPLDPADEYRRYCPEWRGIALQAAEEEPPKRFPSSIITNDDLVISIDLAIWSIQIEHI
jgi:hypothetical protein